MKKQFVTILLVSLFVGISIAAYARDYVYYFLTSCGHEITHISSAPLTDQQIVDLSDSYENIYCPGGAQGPGYDNSGNN